MKIRGLCKPLDGGDWLYGELGLALVGRAMLSRVGLCSLAVSCLA